MTFTLTPISYDALTGWADDDHRAALNAFRQHSRKPNDVTYKTGETGLDAACLAPLWSARDDGSAKEFFEQNFVPCRVETQAYAAAQSVVTGFYEPEVEASPVKTDHFKTPLYARPDSLIDVRAPEFLPEGYRYARRAGDGRLIPFHDRRAIEMGALKDQGLELAWLADPVDAFFIHIQGAAKLRMSNGTIMRVTYDGKSGHPFTAIGKVLIERGEISLKDISMASIRGWLAANPAKARDLMWENRSFIFFKQSDVGDERLGPIAAAKIQLTAGRSLAVDRIIHTFGTPVFVNAEGVNGSSFDRLMIAQETGTAIVGAVRGDIFFGSGDEAGAQAGSVNAPCAFTILVPHGAMDKMANMVRQ